MRTIILIVTIIFMIGFLAGFQVCRLVTYLIDKYHDYLENKEN